VRLRDQAVALVLAVLDVLVVQTVRQGDDAGRGLVRGLLRRRGGGLRGSGGVRGVLVGGDLRVGRGGLVRGVVGIGDRGGVDDRIGLAGGGCVRSRGGGLTALELGDAVVRLLELLLQPLVLGDEFLETRFHVVVEGVVHLVHVGAIGEPDRGVPLIIQVFGAQSHGSPFPSDYVRSAVRAVRSA